MNSSRGNQYQPGLSGLCRAWIIGICGAVGIALLCAGSLASANNDAVTKAKFLYNLAVLSEWPAQSFASRHAPFRFCTLGADEISAALNFIAIGKSINGRPIKVIVLNSIEQAPGCQLVFSSISRQSEITKLSSAISGQPILSVADTEKFAEHGGVVGLSMVRGKVRFTINRTSSGRSKIQINKRLMALGKIVW